MRYINNLNKDNNKTVVQWNSIGRVVVKGSKGIYLKGDGLYFHIDDTVVDTELAKFFLDKRKGNKNIGLFIENRTKAEWNTVGYVVKKNSRGIYSKNKKTILFNVDNTFINRPLARKLLRQQEYKLRKKDSEKKEGLERALTKVVRSSTGYAGF